MIERLLTADGFGVLEGPRYLRVHLDPQILLGRHFLVSLVADGVHPVREGLLDQRERDVEEELAGEDDAALEARFGPSPFVRR